MQARRICPQQYEPFIKNCLAFLNKPANYYGEVSLIISVDVHRNYEAKFA